MKDDEQTICSIQREKEPLISNEFKEIQQRVLSHSGTLLASLPQRQSLQRKAHNDAMILNEPIQRETGTSSAEQHSNTPQ